MISRLLGFIRDMVFAHLFGANAATDAFFVAFKIPNFMRRLFAEGAFSMAFVPVLSEYKEKKSFAELRIFVNDVAGTLGAILFLVTVVGVVAAPWLIYVFAPGFAGEGGQYELAVEMLRLTFPYLFFISLTAFAGGILNSYHRFAVPAFTPVLLNLSLIACAFWLAPKLNEPIVALAWGVLIAGFLQLLFQLPFLHQLKLLPRPRINRKDEGVRRILRLMVPALFGVSVTQLNLLLDTLIASFLITGSISWLYYSDRLMEFPLGILGVALGTVILPSLSRHHAADSPEVFSNTLDWALRWVLLLGFPAAAGLIMLAGPILTTLFFSDAFTSDDVLMSSRSLMAYALGLVSFMAIKVLAPGYYARLDTRSPVRIGIIAMVVNMIFNLLLMFPLGHVGLALATTISATVNAYLLWRGLRRDNVYKPCGNWSKLFVQALLACAAMVAVLAFGVGQLEGWFEATSWSRVIWLLSLVLAAGATYFFTLFVVGVRPRHFRNRAV